MSGIALLLAGFALAVTVLWSIANDNVPLRGRTGGWLAMRDHGAKEKRESDWTDRNSAEY